MHLSCSLENERKSDGLLVIIDDAWRNKEQNVNESEKAREREKKID